MSDDPFEAIKATFFQECEELIGDLESGLLALENGTGDDETVNAVFRAVHSVKGGAGAFGLEDLVGFAHVFETLLDELRAGRKPCDDITIKTLLRAADVLSDHIQAARGLSAPVDAARSAGLVAELEALTHGAPLAAAAPAFEAPTAVPVHNAAPQDDDGFGDFVFQPISMDVQPLDALPVTAPSDDDGMPVLVAAPLDLNDIIPGSAPVEAVSGPADWIVTFRPTARMYATANEAALLLRELARLGRTVTTLDAASVPMLQDLAPDQSYLGWRVQIDGDVSEAAIRDVFEFVDGECVLSIHRDGEAEVAEGAAPASAPTAPDAPAADGFDIAALLATASTPVEAPAAVVAPVIAPAPVAAPAPAPAPAPVPAQPSLASAAPVATPSAAASAPVTIRVDLERVDRMINAVGELVIQQAMLAQRVMESGIARSSDVALGLEDLEMLTREIQDSVMAIRAQPVRSVFQRMPRLAREVADSTGKQVRLVTEGESTEVDKTVIERLSEPITHMLRNAIDHGLETPEKRVAAGKPAEGVVRLSAAHRSGRIVIELSDDGAGINRERVRAIAVERGLIDENANLSVEEIDNLIFLPGFSTASSISNISGRGVGMDVVQRSIQAVGGRISISSRPGQGSTFTLSLPLTLAVLDGMVVSAADQTFVAPLAAIIESLTPDPKDIHSVVGKTSVIRFRDQFVPLIDVAATLGVGAPTEPSTGVAMIVEDGGGSRAALLVNAIQGQRQVVIKGLETNFQPVDGIAAATILGDGRVALILDVDALVTNQRRPSRPESKSDFKIAS